MLQDIRDKSQGWIAKAIIVVIVLLLALTGFDAIFRSVSHDKDVATVNGESITKAAFNSMFEQRRYLLSRNGQFDGSPEVVEALKKQVMEDLVNYQIMLEAAKNSGFGYLPEVIIKRITEQNPNFQNSNGQFDPVIFRQVISNYGMTEQQYIANELEKALLTQLQSGIVDAEFSTSNQVLYFAKLLGQTRNFSYKELNASDIKNISNDEISAWYQQHKDTLKTSEQVVLQFIELKKDDFLDQVKVSDQELRDLYTKKVVELNKSSERKRIAHILIPVTANQTDGQAKAKIDEIAKALKEGKDFTDLAKKDSQDIATANNGGDLGFVTDEDLPDQQAFAPVLNKLDKVGDVSEPVRSKFGWHLIKLTDVHKTVIPTFESLHDQLASELKQQKAYDAFLNAQSNLDKLAYESYDNLSSVADQLNLKLGETKPFARDDGYDELTTNEKLIKTAFSESLVKGQENSSIIELNPNKVVVIRVKEHFEPAMMTLEQAKPLAIKAIESEKVKSEGEQLIANIKAGKLSIKDWQSFDQVKQPLQMQLLNENVNKLPYSAEVLEQVFSTPKPINDKPSLIGITLKNGNYAIIALTKVNDFEGTLSEEQSAQYQSIVTADVSSLLWSEYLQYIKDKAKVKYYDND